MAGFERIKDQSLPIRLLTTFLRKGIVPHALLFTGMEGVGKKSTARLFAMACNCQAPASVATVDNNRLSGFPENPCGQCKACRKIASNTHPDVIWIKPEPVLIRISQVRELNKNLALKPYEARYRVVVMSDAQSLNPEAANAFLKMLEEPPDKTLLILTAERASDLLPTIVSRCQRIRFNPLSTDSLSSMLVDQNRLDPVVAAVVAEAAAGSYGRARAFVKDKRWMDKRNWLINQLETISVQPVENILATASRLSKKKDTVAEMLAIATCWLRDIAVYRFAPDNIINKDLAARVCAVSQNSPLNSLLDQIDAVQEAQKKLKANTNLRLTLEGLLLKLAALAA